LDLDRSEVLRRVVVMASILIAVHAARQSFTFGNEGKIGPAMMDAAAQSIRLVLGEQVQVALPGRGSGGFVWSVAPSGDAGIVSIERKSASRPPMPPPGGAPPNSFSLDEILVITGRRIGTAVLDARLSRPGGEQAPIDRRRIRVEVVAAGPTP
jgi:hypothetical protein